jgi:hypothetical protein
MDRLQGAGARFVTQHERGQLQYIATENVIRDREHNQDFFVTDRARIIRHDRNGSLCNAYDASRSDFAPTSLTDGEYPVETDGARQLIELLIPETGWAHYMVHKGSKFAAGVAKSAIVGGSTYWVAQHIGPALQVACETFNAVTRHAVEPSGEVVGGVAARMLRLNANPATGPMSYSAGVQTGAGHLAIPLGQAMASAADSTEEIPGRQANRGVRVFKVCGPAVGSGVGFLIGGPPGAFVGGTLGAGTSAMFE